MQIFWLRPSSQDINECELLSPKAKEQVKTISEKAEASRRDSTKYPLSLSFQKVQELIDNVEIQILSDQARKILCQRYYDWVHLQQSFEQLKQVQDFFSNHVNSLFIQLVEKIFNNNTFYIKTLVLTIDYFMNLQTFLIYLYWLVIKNKVQLILIENTLQEIIKIRYICLNNNIALEQFIHFLFDNSVSIPRLRPYVLIQQPLLGHESLNIFLVEPVVLSNALTEINEEFYSQLQFVNLLSRLENGNQSEFLQNYFDRVNSFSLFTQLCIIRQEDRKKAVDYFYEVCLELCNNEDGEGVFQLYKLSLERLDQDIIKHHQYISNAQQSVILDMSKSFVCNKHIYAPTQTNKLYPIPSFFEFWTNLKKLELALKQTKNILYLDSIRKILVDLMFIRQSNCARLSTRTKHCDSFLKYFLLKGHQEQLSYVLQVPKGRWNQMQLKLMNLALN